MKKLIKRIYNKTFRRLYSFISSKRIISLVNKNKWNKIDKLNYNHLNLLKEYDIDKFKEVKEKLENNNINNLKNKDKVKVGFVLYTSSMWSCEELFKKMQEDPKMDPYVIVCELGKTSTKSTDDNYANTVKYFKDNNYPVVEASSISFNKEVLNDFDIIFYLTPFTIYPKELNILNLKLNVLTVYITYSFMIADREKKFSLPTYQLTWKFFADTSFYKKMMKEKCLTGDDNVMFCGYTRMDEFYNDNVINSNEIWKIPTGSKKNVYKIIYAPHHSVFDEKAGYSTFDQNYKFILDLAKKYKDNTSWIIKPHPLLRSRIIKNGFFSNEEEYDNYLKEWDSLPNAKVVTSGTYFDIFKTSDTMILDSVSFLAEYQYVHKPLLFLTRSSQQFNEFGDNLKKVLYCTEGDNFEGIENYLKDVVINNNDYMKKEREEFFEKYLDYYKYNNNQLASEYVYNYLKKLIQ